MIREAFEEDMKASVHYRMLSLRDRYGCTMIFKAKHRAEAFFISWLVSSCSQTGWEMKSYIFVCSKYFNISWIDWLSLVFCTDGKWETDLLVTYAEMPGGAQLFRMSARQREGQCNFRVMTQWQGAGTRQSVQSPPSWLEETFSRFSLSCLFI